MGIPLHCSTAATMLLNPFTARGFESAFSINFLYSLTIYTDCIRKTAKFVEKSDI